MNEEMSAQVQQIIADSRIRWDRLRHTIGGLARLEGVQQAELARKMGMSPQTLSTRLSGQTTITPWEIDGFAAILGVDRETLDLEPPAAMQWLLQHRPELVARSR